MPKKPLGSIKIKSRKRPLETKKVKKGPSKLVRVGRRAFPTSSRKIYAKSLVKSVFRKQFGQNLVSVTLYGSVARGKAKVTSDIDINVFVRGWADYPDKKKHDTFWKLRNKIDKMTEEGGFRVDFNIFDVFGEGIAKQDKKIYG